MKKLFLYIILIFHLFLSISGCKNEVSKNLVKIGNTYQNNDIQKLIRRYVNSEHEEALCFLLGNIDNKYSFEVKPFTTDGEKIHELIYEKRGNINTLKKIYNSIDLNEASLIYFDFDSINYGFLNEVIKYSYKAYEKPWSKPNSQIIFLNNILPYRFLTEPLSNYKKKIFEQFESHLDSIYRQSGEKGIIEYLMDYLSNNFTRDSLYSEYMDGIQSVNNMCESKRGDKYDEVVFCAAVFSSNGIPVKIHESIYNKWCLIKIGDSWKILNRSSDTNRFNLYDSLTIDPLIVNELSFKKPEIHITNLFSDYKNIPHILNHYSINVSEQYFNTFTNNIIIEDSTRAPYYLTILLPNKWEFVSWELPKHGNVLEFDNLKKNMVYGVALFNNLNIEWPGVSYVFYIDKSGNINYLSTTPPSNNKNSITIKCSEKKDSKLITIGNYCIDTPLYSTETYMYYWDGKEWVLFDKKLLVREEITFNNLDDNHLYSFRVFSKGPNYRAVNFSFFNGILKIWNTNE